MRLTTKKISKPCIIGLCEGNPSTTGGFPSPKGQWCGRGVHCMTSSCLSTAIDAPPRHLPHPPLPRRSQSLPTSDLGACQPLLGPSKDSTITKTLLCKRLVVVLVFCAILAIGIVFRLSYEMNSSELPDTNMTTSTVNTWWRHQMETVSA